MMTRDEAFKRFTVRWDLLYLLAVLGIMSPGDYASAMRLLHNRKCEDTYAAII
jgi:hypothetical protein